MDDKPVITFDYGQTGNLTQALLEEAQDVLAMCGKSQRPLVDRVRALHTNRGSDSTFKQVLRIVQDYVHIYPLDFNSMATALGGVDQAVKFLPGVEPPPVVWKTLQLLREEHTADSLVQDYWRTILDMMENGEASTMAYASISNYYRFDMRGLKPGYTPRKHSKELVVSRSA